LRERRQHRPDDRADDRRENKEGQLQRFAREVQRKEMDIGFAAQQKSGNGKDKDEGAAQQRSRAPAAGALRPRFQ
jgi:hypothetical protein